MPAGSPPTHFYVPEGARFTIADEICDLMEAVGYQIDEPERLASHAMFPQKANGDWMGLESGIVVSRQNLKTAMEIGGALHDTFVQGVPAAWTAHEFKTSAEAFRDLTSIIEGHDWLSSEVLNIRTAHGFEGFDLRNGARLDVLARTGKSGRGMARPRLYIDEAMFATAHMMGAIVPTMSAMPNAHMVIASSPGLPSSAILRNYRKRGRSGVDKHLGWIEWSQEQGACADQECRHEPGTPGCWLDDMEAVLRVNPAAPRRISLEYLQQERHTLSGPMIPEYLRERMGVWEDPVGEGEGTLYPVDEWVECEDPTSEIVEGAPLVFAVDLSWDRERAHIAVAGLRADGLVHIDRIAILQPGEVKGFLAERRRRFAPLALAYQGTSAPVSSIGSELEECGIPLHPITGSDVAKASGHMYDAIRQQRVRHLGRPDLLQAASTAVPRMLGDGWAVDRKKSPTDVAGFVSCLEALWVLDQLVGSSSYDVASSVY